MTCATCSFFLALNALENFFAMNGNFLRRINADADLIAFDAKDSNGDVVSDHHSFTDASSENQHESLLA
jgi:hypothetical protein